MELLLERNQLLQDRTLGVLYHFPNGLKTKLCDTLEDAHHTFKIKDQTCIPEGRFKVELTESPKFKRILPLVWDVPNFSGIRIHRGNTPLDTSGCILVGKLYKDVLVDSAKTEIELVEKLNHAALIAEEIWLEIVLKV